MSGARLIDWRDKQAYIRLASVGRSGLMWEWLRRDPGYRAYAQNVVRKATQKSGEMLLSDPVAVARWGIHFRRES